METQRYVSKHLGNVRLFFAWTSEFSEVKKIPMLKFSASLQRMSEKLLHRESTLPAVLCLSYPLPFDPLPSLLVGMHSVLFPSQGAPPDGNGPLRASLSTKGT